MFHSYSKSNTGSSFFPTQQTALFSYSFFCGQKVLELELMPFTLRSIPVFYETRIGLQVSCKKFINCRESVDEQRLARAASNQPPASFFSSRIHKLVDNLDFR